MKVSRIKQTLESIFPLLEYAHVSSTFFQNILEDERIYVQVSKGNPPQEEQLVERFVIDGHLFQITSVPFRFLWIFPMEETKVYWQ